MNGRQSHRRGTERTLEQHIVLMSGARLLSYVAGVAMGFLNAYVLGPAQLGVMKTIGLITGYAGYNDLGMMKGLYRDLPIVIGRGDGEGRQRLQNTALTNSVITTAAAGALLAVLYASGVTFKGSLTAVTMPLIAAYLILDTLVQFYDFVAKGAGEFRAVARRDAAVTLVSLAAGVPFLLLWGVPGLLGSFLVMYLFQIAFMQRALRLHLRPVWDWARTRALLRTGSLMMLNAFVGQVYWTIDLTLIAVFLPMRDVGVYGFALGALSAAEIVPGVINRAVFQRMGYTWGAGDRDVRQMRRYLRSPWLLYLLVSTISAGSMYFVFGVGIRTLLPAYERSLGILGLLVLGYMFFTLRGFSTTFMNVADRIPMLSAIQGLGLATNVILDLVLIPRFGIAGAAMGSGASYVVFSFVVCWVVLRQVYGSRHHAAAFFARASACFVAAAASMVGLGYLGTGLYSDLDGRLMRVVVGAAVGSIQCALYALACLAVFLLVFRAWGLAPEIARTARAVFSRAPRPPVGDEAGEAPVDVGTRPHIRAGRPEHERATDLRPVERD